MAGSPLGGARVAVCAHTNVAVDRVMLGAPRCALRYAVSCLLRSCAWLHVPRCGECLGVVCRLQHRHRLSPIPASPALRASKPPDTSAGLQESGCTDFLRVGALRRLDRRLLPQSLHASESRATATAAAELREMLKEAGSPAERAAIQAELAAAERGACLLGAPLLLPPLRLRLQLLVLARGGAVMRAVCAMWLELVASACDEGPWLILLPATLTSHPTHSGADRQRKRLLKTVPVVGVTCCSSTLAALDGLQVRGEVIFSGLDSTVHLADERCAMRCR